MRRASRPLVAIPAAIAAMGLALAVTAAAPTLASPRAPALPKHTLTPGAYTPSAGTARICGPGWPRTGPPLPDWVQRAVFARYRLAWASRSHYSIDLLVPRELGGTTATANLWPQPRSAVAGLGSQVLAKNRLEDTLRARVCGHTVALATARHALGVSWFAAYHHYVSRNPTPVQTQTMTPTQPPTRPTAPVPAPGPTTAGPGAATSVTVHTAEGLRAALRDARPGTDISLADGRYALSDGPITVSAACSAASPCSLHGGRGAVLDGTAMTAAGHYGLHLQGAAYWTVAGFRITDANKGVVLDASSHDTLSDLEVDHVGDEGIHLRDNSSADLVRANDVHDTGLVQPGFGEGIYIGSAKSNWAMWSQGRPDASNGDTVTGNTIARTSAENVDIKEGTSGGVLSANSFDASAIAGKNSADSWVDVKGNGWLITGNHGSNPTDNPNFQDGFQTHVQVDGDGQGNRFTANRADLGAASGFAFNLERARSTGNIVDCDNTVSGPHARLSNEACTQG